MRFSPSIFSLFQSRMVKRVSNSAAIMYDARILILRALLFTHQIDDWCLSNTPKLVVFQEVNAHAI